MLHGVSFLEAYPTAKPRSVGVIPTGKFCGRIRGFSPFVFEKYDHVPNAMHGEREWVPCSSADPDAVPMIYVDVEVFGFVAENGRPLVMTRKLVARFERLADGKYGKFARLLGALLGIDPSEVEAAQPNLNDFIGDGVVVTISRGRNSGANFLSHVEVPPAGPAEDLHRFLECVHPVPAPIDDDWAESQAERAA